MNQIKFEITTRFVESSIMTTKSSITFSKKKKLKLNKNLTQLKLNFIPSLRIGNTFSIIGTCLLSYSFFIFSFLPTISVTRVHNAIILCERFVSRLPNTSSRTFILRLLQLFIDNRSGALITLRGNYIILDRVWIIEDVYKIADTDFISDIKRLAIVLFCVGIISRFT